MPEPKPINLLPRDGEVYFFPNFLSGEASTKSQETLLEQIPWKQEPIKLFGKKVMQPRLTAWCGEKNYTYSGITMEAQPWPPSLLSLRKKIESLGPSRFNSALLNLYRNGNDSMGWHSDDEKELGLNPVIASLSLGETRNFQFRHKKLDIKISLPLTNGSLLWMAGETQHHWKHAIPKTKKTLGARINITFRNIIA